VDTFRIRTATSEDAEAIARVQIDTWRSTYRGIVPDEHLASLSLDQGRERWRTGLSTGSTMTVFVAENESGGVVGFAACGPVRESEKEYAGELYAIYVIKESQGAGVGRMLCREVAKDLKRRGLDTMLIWVLAQNPFSGFYERLGGKRVRTREITIGGKTLKEWGYGWKSLDALIHG